MLSHSLISQTGTAYFRYIPAPTRGPRTVGASIGLFGPNELFRLSEGVLLVEHLLRHQVERTMFTLSSFGQRKITEITVLRYLT